MGTVETLYDDTDHVEHWDHPKPAPGKTCAAGTVHLHTSRLDYSLGGLFGVANSMRLSRQRLAELLGLTVEDIAYVSLGGPGRSDSVGFAFTLAADSRYGFARVAYDPKRLWTLCRVEHPVPTWWHKGCVCAVELPRGPVATAMQTAADMIRRSMP
jgi:hypothetical protein